MSLHTPSSSWKFCLSPGETWDAVYGDYKAAQKSIKIEQYIFENDAVGQKFMRLFIDLAKAGVQVRLLCDEIGSHAFMHSPLVAQLRERGGVFQFYNSPRWIDLLKPRRFFPRTHVKSSVIDGQIAYIGGVCFAERMKGWRDTQLRVTGPVVEQIERALDQNFQEVLSPKPKKGVSLVKIGFLDEDFSYIQNDPGFLRHPIYYALLNTIRHARKTIYISAAFFIPPRRLRRLLIEAATHGADVILLVTEHSDFWIADWAFLSYAVRLLKGGVRIFLYLPTVLHTKTTVIDGAWGTVGSCNMDPLSFFHNREANLIVKDRDALARMEKDFLADLEQSRELTLQSFKMIPLWKRIAMHAARLMRPVL